MKNLSNLIAKLQEYKKFKRLSLYSYAFLIWFKMLCLCFLMLLVSCSSVKKKVDVSCINYDKINNIKIIVVKGSPYQMGAQLGNALKEEINQNINNFYNYTVKNYPNVQIDEILDKAWEINSKFIDKRIIDEMKGVADGSGVPLKMLKRIHTIPVISPYSCSGVIVWGDATLNGHTYQIRNLDYTVDAKLQENPVIVIYIPNEGIPHANITFAGYIASHTGINSQHVVFGEKGQSPKKEYPYNLNGTHFSFLFRTLEYDAKSLDYALQKIKSTPLIKRYYFFVSEGKRKKAAGVKIFVNSPDKNKIAIFKDNDSNDSKVPKVFKNCVYYTMKNKKAADFIQKNLGKFDEKSMIELSKLVAAKKNLINVVYDASTLEIWVAYASADSPAAKQKYVHIDLKNYF